MLEPEMIAFIHRVEAAFPASAQGPGPAERRALYDAYCVAHNPPRPPGVESVDVSVTGGEGGAVPVRSYRSSLRPRAGTILYLHGGGFVLGGLESHDFFTAELAARTGLTVVAVDYRLAPEHRYPAARDDARTVLDRLQDYPGAFHAEAGVLFVGGDSAGANLAAGLALYNRQRGGPPLAGQFLIYPTLAPEPLPPAAQTEAEAPMLSLADVHAFNQLYHGDAPPVADPFAFPLVAPALSGLPPALLLPVEHDPLRDEALAYHRRLQAAGVDSTLHLGHGLVHGCLRALGQSPGVGTLVSTLCRWLSVRSGAVSIDPGSR